MMDEILFEVSLFQDSTDRDRSQLCLVILMDALAKVNVTWLEAHPETSPLYQAPVKYHFDPDEPDPWQDIPSTIAKGYGDCEDLACWRIAEYRIKGIDARPLIRWRKNENGKYTYHALLRLPDGRTEDPSVSMGMKGKMIRRPVYVEDE